jgi:hypothetical protein
VRTQWRLYDAEAAAFVFEGASNGFGRGQNLGTNGVEPNAMLDAFESCLSDLMAKPEFQAAIKAGATSAPAGEAGAS